MTYSPLDHERILREALESKQDPHKAIAAWLANKPIEQVTIEERNQTKALNFHLLYSPEFMKTVNWKKIP